MDAECMETLIDIAIMDESKLSDVKAKRSLSLLQTFIVRGLYNMTRVLKNEYLEFLQTYDLLSKFFKVLLGVANQISASPDEFLVSSLLLEIKADYLRETVMSAKNLSAGEKE